ncbi:MAG: hypothetical protein WCJ70_01295 [bacterium]
MTFHLSLFKKSFSAWYKDNTMIFFALCAIFVFGFFLRIATLEQNLLFGFEQGRDALKATDIYSLKDIVLIGPKTDLDGIFHGVWYYYLIAILYFLFAGNPLYVTYALASINTLTIFVIYALARNLSVSKVFSLFASLLFAASFITVSYARWLSNVSPSIFVVGCFMLSLLLLVKQRKDYYWIPTFILFALLFHFELLHGLYAGVLLVISIFIYKLPLYSKRFFIGLAGFAVINTPFVIFDLKNSFILSKGILHYLTSSAPSPSPVTAFSLYFEGLLSELVSTFSTKFAMAPFVLFFLMLIVILCTVELKKSREVSLLLLFTLWSFPYTFLVKNHLLEQFYAGTSISFILVFIFGMEIASNHMSRRVLIGALILLSVGMTHETYRRLTTRDAIFFHKVQKMKVYGDQIKMISKMVTPLRSFEWEAFTIPYNQSEAYQYLLPWYGRQIVGDKVVDMLSAKNRDDYYLIVEPDTEGYWLDKWYKEKDGVSTIVSEQQFGGMKLQLRKKM